MKTRIIVAAIGLPVIMAVLLLTPLWCVSIMVGAIAAASAWELLHCVEKDISPRMAAYASVSAFAIPVLTAFFDSGMVSGTVIFLLFALSFIELMLSFETKDEPMDMKCVAMTIIAGAVMPVLLTSIVRLGDMENGRAYVLLPFVAAFLSDSGAYFVGVFLGKHKLCPRLSPNKTIEGSAGGFIIAIAAMLLYGVILKALDYQVNMAVMGVYGFIGSMACQLGDLSFSALKRLCNVKDYGTLIPGHGGMLDRFDSMFWTAAALWLLVCIAPAIA